METSLFSIPELNYYSIICIIICSAVSLETGYELEERGGCSSNLSRSKNFLTFLYRPERLWAQYQLDSPFQLVLGAVSLAVKRPESEADHSPPSSAEVK
jgi:hypothetical protein